MKVMIIAGGQPDSDDGRQWAQAADLIIGADGGAAWALAWGLVPGVIVGDLDSLAEKDRRVLQARGCRFIVQPRAKDETDLELALSYAVRQGAREIVVIGALGGRLDHLLANLLLLALPELDGVSVRIVDGRQEALLVRGGEAVTLSGQPGDLVSLLPVGGDAQGVRTTGLAWALAGETLRFGFSRGVSNEMTGPVARVEVEDGYLLVVHSRQEGDER